MLSPIVLFVYNRPLLTLETLTALSRNALAKDSLLYIFCDGPKKEASEEDLKNINEVRQLIRSQNWCKETIIIERDVNKGLSKSIIEGVTEVINKHGTAIVLEDDIVTSPYFLDFMNDALSVYKTEDEVLSIGACNFFLKERAIKESTFFLNIPDCWGWATWMDRWSMFEPDGKVLLEKLTNQNLLDKFNLHGAYDYEKMLREQIEQKIDSWAIRWQALAVIKHKLTLYPKNSVTINIGQSIGSTNFKQKIYPTDLKFPKEKIYVEKIPVTESEIVMKELLKSYDKFHNLSFARRLKDRILSTFMKRK